MALRVAPFAEVGDPTDVEGDARGGHHEEEDHRRRPAARAQAFGDARLAEGGADQPGADDRDHQEAVEVGADRHGDLEVDRVEGDEEDHCQHRREQPGQRPFRPRPGVSLPSRGRSGHGGVHRAGSCSASKTPRSSPVPPSPDARQPRAIVWAGMISMHQTPKTTKKTSRPIWMFGVLVDDAADRVARACGVTTAGSAECSAGVPGCPHVAAERLRRGVGERERLGFGRGLGEDRDRAEGRGCSRTAAGRRAPSPMICELR